MEPFDIEFPEHHPLPTFEVSIYSTDIHDNERLVCQPQSITQDGTFQVLPPNKETPFLKLPLRIEIKRVI